MGGLADATPTLRTPRLLLRPWRRDDLDVMARWPPFPDPLDAVWNWAQSLREQGTTDLFFLSRASDPRRREWTILTHADEIIGHVGIRDIDTTARSARLGIGFGWSYVDQGYGREVLGALLDAFFGPMGFVLMQLDVAAHNRRAYHLYRSLGFHDTSTFWRMIGGADEYAFLADTSYDEIRSLVRVTRNGAYALWHEMELRGEVWAGHSPGRDGPSA